MNFKLIKSQCVKNLVVQIISVLVSNSLLSNSQIFLLEKHATSKQILGDAFYWRIFMKPLSSLSLSPDSSWEWCRTQKTTAACWMDGRTDSRPVANDKNVCLPPSWLAEPSVGIEQFEDYWSAKKFITLVLLSITFSVSKIFVKILILLIILDTN